MGCAETDAHEHDAVAIGRGAKVDVCHVDQETGTWETINISENAVARHLSNHGDWLVAEDDATADGIDDDCDDEPDPDDTGDPADGPADTGLGADPG